MILEGIGRQNQGSSRWRRFPRGGDPRPKRRLSAKCPIRVPRGAFLLSAWHPSPEVTRLARRCSSAKRLAPIPALAPFPRGSFPPGLPFVTA